MDPKKIGKLSREQKLQLLDLLDEKKKRLRDKRAVYLPNSGQLPVHQSKARLRAVFSGNGAGKTAMAVNEVIWRAQGFNPITEVFTPVPAKIVVVLDRPEKVEEVWVPEIKKWLNLKQEHLHKDGRHYISRIVLDTGSTIRFMFHLQEPMAFESIECDFVVFDEPPPRPIYIALQRGGRTKNRQPRFLIVGTPIAGSWMRKEIYDPWSRGERKDIDCFRFGTQVNANNLAAGYVDDFGKSLSEKEKRIRFHGEFFDLDGLALAHLFDRQTHVISPLDKEDLVSCVVAIDPHPSKQHTAVLLGVDRAGRLYVVDEYSSKQIPREFGRSLKERWLGTYKIFDIVVDSLGATPMSGGEGNKSFIDVLNDIGVRARSTRYEDKNDEVWIMKIQEVLKTPEEPDNFGQQIPTLRVYNHCRGIISDIESVSWQKFRNEDIFKPKLDITNKDYLAALKYALACNLSPSKVKTKVWKRKDLKKVYR